MSRNNKGCCRFSWCCVINVVGLSAIAAVLIWYFAFFAKDVEEYKSVADCGGCYCIPDNTTSMECPSTKNNNADVLPKSYYPQETINVWQSQTILNPYQLNCNPYKDNDDDNSCDTEPPLNQEYVDLGDTAVCAIHFEEEDGASSNSNNDNNATCKENNIEGSSYRIQTYPSRSDAESAGGYVTHVGHCGVCSTLQDLAVYANILYVGLTSPGNFCRRQASSQLENGLSCYRNLGLTLDCAKIWADTSWNTASNCFGSCILPTAPVFGGGGGSGDGDNGLNTTVGNVTSVNINITNITDLSDSDDGSSWMNDLPSTIKDLPATIKDKFLNLVDSAEPIPESPNGPAPDCAINECLVCNEKESGAVFDKFAGRNRRNSGLVSTVAYPCGTMPNIVQDPCPSTEPLVAQE